MVEGFHDILRTHLHVPKKYECSRSLTKDYNLLNFTFKTCLPQLKTKKENNIGVRDQHEYGPFDLRLFEGSPLLHDRVYCSSLGRWGWTWGGGGDFLGLL